MDVGGPRHRRVRGVPPAERVMGSVSEESAVQRLQRSRASIWLVQCNPRVTDLLASSRTALPDAWCVKRHLNDIRRGDRVVLWLSGRDAGAYALGEVTAEATASAPPDDAAAEPPPIKVGVDLFLDLFDRPVRRAVLTADPRFADEPIVRRPFAANPHRVSPDAFDAILERVAAPE